MKKPPRHNLGQTDRSVTVKRYIRWEPESSRRIWEACRQQATARNRAIEELLKRPATPLRKSKAQGITGLQGLWLQWRTEAPALAEIPQCIWRPGVATAKSQVDAWEETNERQADIILSNAEQDEEDDKEGGKRRRLSRRRLCPSKLFYSRKQRDRQRRNRLVVHEGIKKLDEQTLRIYGVGVIKLQEPLPEGFNVRSTTLIERTPRERGRNIAPEERSWEIHLTTRVPARLKALPDEPVTVGIDHGVKHALTMSDSQGNVEYLHYDEPPAADRRRYEQLDRRKKQCRGGRRRSRKRRALQRRQRRLRNRAVRKRAHQRREWANRIAQRYNLVAIEDLQVANMVRSARGTSEQPGRNVRAKSGLNRKLAESSPGYQTTELVNACIRHGARYRRVPAGGTSITCAECGHRDRRNRESQAVFRDRGCGHEANADANAGEVIRLFGEAYTGVGVSRSWATEEVARRAEVARGKAARAKAATMDQRSSRPETRPPKPAAGRREAATRRPQQREAPQIMRESRCNLRSS